MDFVAVTAEPLAGTALNAVESVHRRLDLEPGPAFDGFYLDRSELALPPDPTRVRPFELAGHFHRRTPCFETNPATWSIWCDHGVTIRGPAPETLGLRIDAQALARFERANLAHYWTDWVVAHWPGPPDAERASWGVLGVLRLAHVLETGRVPSKTAAGEWALRRFAPAWRPVIAMALATRRGVPPVLSPAEFQAAVDFVAFVIAETGAQHPLR